MVGGAVFPQGGGAAQKASLPASMQVSEPKEHLSVPSAAAARQPAGRVGNGGSAPCRSLNVMYDLECHRGYLALSSSRTNSSPLGRHVRAGKEVGSRGLAERYLPQTGCCGGVHRLFMVVIEQI